MLEALAQNAAGIPAGAGSGGGVRGAADPAAVARFNAALQGEPLPRSISDGALQADGQPVPALVAPTSSTTASRFANDVKAALQGVSQSWHEVMHNVAATDDMSLATLTRLQMTTLGATFQIDLATKLISKPPQIIDQLVKTQ
ncbi:EscI/YscI/HrpB family type III secretion system inner rod protein [Robbsia andropogonis]|uniref:EscI/YscI/HrpB family type III secretion system inner rod protein n=1 Tax=Robbsia andropogonis TaxID=28092 RepID=UPI003D21BC44